MDKRAKVEKALAGGAAIPAGPAVMSRINELCRNPNATARDLGKVLQLDPALTSRLLKQVNSSFYGLSATIKTITHAVVILGFQEVKNLVFTVPVAQLFDENRKRPGLDIARLWDQTVERACLARAISYHIQHPIPEQVFVSAILADTGMVILNNILGEEYAEVVGRCGSDDFLPEVEEAELGISHIEVGRRMAESWSFPPELVGAIGRHHDPVGEDGSLHVEAALVHVAIKLWTSWNEETDAETVLSELPSELSIPLALDGEALRSILEKGAKEFQQAKSMLAAN